MKHSIRNFMTVCLLLLAVSAARAADVVTTTQPTDTTQTKATLQAAFLPGSTANGFEYKYGTIPERTEFVNYAIAPTGDPLVFTQGSTAWRAVPRMGWVESPDDNSSTLNASFSTTFTLTQATTISFDWQVDSEEGIGILAFSVDGTQVASITGQTDFATFTHALDAGSHTLSWTYRRSSSENAGLGIGRLKNLNVQNTTAGEWIDKPASGSSLQLTGLYPAQQYLFRAYSTIGGVKSYSAIKQFGTKEVKIGTPEVTDTTQTTATVTCTVEPGDAEVETGFVLDATRPTLSDAFAEALLSPYSDGISISKGSWSTANDFVYVNRNSDGLSFSTTFTLTQETTISFDYTVFNGRINFTVDGSTTQLTAASEHITRTLDAGTHTLSWSTYYNSSYSTYRATVSNLLVTNTTSDNKYLNQDVVVSRNGDEITYKFQGLKPNSVHIVSAYMKPTYTSDLEKRWSPEVSQIITFTTLPVVATADSVTNRRQASATLNGSIDGGDATIVAKGLQYRNATTARWSNATTTVSGNKLTANIRSLRPATKYEWRAYIQAEDCDTVFSDVAEFATDTVRALKPVLVSRTQHTATVQGEVIAGDATVYARGMQFRAQGTEEWESVEDLGEDDKYIISKTNLTLNTAYEARTYVQQAGNEFIYSDILVFRTKNIEAHIDSITDVYQRTAVIHGHVDNGEVAVTGKKIHVYSISGSTKTEVAVVDVASNDSLFSQRITGLQPETNYGFILEVANAESDPVLSGSSVEDDFTEALLSPWSSSAVTTTHDDTWLAGDGYVYMTTKTDYKNVTATFTLTKEATISFDYSVSNGRIYLYVDNSSQQQLSNSGHFTRTLSAGQHTLRWSSWYSGNYYARISNLLIPKEATTEGNVGNATCKTLSFFKAESLTATDITQTTATLKATKEVTDETGVEYGFRYGGEEDFYYSEDCPIAPASAVADTLFANITGLSPNYYYMYRAYAKIGNETYYSSIKDFGTLPVGINITMSNVTQTSATATVTTEAGNASITNLQYRLSYDDDYKNVSGPISITGLTPNRTYYIYLKWNVGSETYTYSYSFSTLATTASATYSELAQTSVVLTMHANNGTATLVASGIEYSANGENYTMQLSDNNGLRINELLPNTSYSFRPFIETTEGGKVYGSTVTVRTKAITLTTLKESSISNRSATLNGTIDCDSYSSAEFGFQWKEKTGWTADPRFTKGRKNDDGSISVALVNGMLEPNTEYEYRTAVRYHDNIYYASEWRTFRTESEFVLYPATVYTVYRTDSENNRLILCGYYVAGSEQVTGQGYEYWANSSQAASQHRAQGSVTRITAGEDMVAELDPSLLADGTYSLRAYVETQSETTGKTATTYGNVVLFTVGDANGIQQLTAGNVSCYGTNGCVVLRNANGLNAKIYTLSGQLQTTTDCRETTERISLPQGIYVVRLSNGQAFKVSVKR